MPTTFAIDSAATAIHGRKVLLVGLGRSGMAALKLLVARGARVNVTDEADVSKLGPGLMEASQYAEKIGVGAFREEWFDRAELIVVSPGVPLAHEIFRAPRKRGVPIVAEVELASWFVSVPVLGVTGSNGKSTVTALAGEMLRASGLRPFVGGNLGVALSHLPLAREEHDIAVVELSSFQLEATDRLHPVAALITNLTPNHQDRYPSFDDYVRAKLNIFRRMDARDTSILNARDDGTARHVRNAPGRTWWFGDPDRPGAHVRDGRLVIATDTLRAELDLASFRLPGAHNVENLEAAALLALAGGATEGGIAAAMASFPGLDHRLEFVLDSQGVRFVNDSKATSVDAVATALEAMNGRVILLLGGHDKGGDFTQLADLLRSRARLVICFGESGPQIAEQLAGIVSVEVATRLDDAFVKALAAETPGDTVLLSPGCTSHDAYRDFEQRGEHFRELCRAL
ncbi:MAG: UDP-N-acetylmuramoyl-L-alanine--D-glutamate ligase [Deltaproteobacteria bacterium]|nr:UDP-N-acetylmuramoyl-L-alanine--D-glutamate ligase [Deltaproteobacteria bacterium]